MAIRKVAPAIKQLTKPLAYLRIHHPAKAAFDWIVPAVLATVMWLFLTFVVTDVQVFKSGGLIAGVNGLLQVLIGFYIAGLAAIATFQKPGLDELISGDPAILEEEVRGRRLEVALTRRRFLCYLFGYLAWASLALYFFGLLADLSASTVLSKLSASYQSAVKYGGLLIYLLALSSLFVTTLVGLYYMSHRLHLEEPKDIRPGGNAAK